MQLSLIRRYFLSMLLVLAFLPNCVSFGQNTDIRLLREIYFNRNPQLDNFNRFVSDSDIFLSVGVPAGVLATGLLKHDPATTQKGLDIAASFAITSAATLVLKYAIDRPRPFVTYPDIIPLAEASSPSFPSGHTSTAFSTATSLSLNYPKWYVIAPSAVYACAVGYSRMALGVHYPSDVLVGALIGTGTAVATHYLHKKLLHQKK